MRGGRDLVDAAVTAEDAAPLDLLNRLKNLLNLLPVNLPMVNDSHIVSYTHAWSHGGGLKIRLGRVCISLCLSFVSQAVLSSFRHCKPNTTALKSKLANRGKEVRHRNC